MAGTPDFAICNRLMTLASDPDNQGFIVKEQGCMSGLVAYLDNACVEIVSMSARTIWFLSQSPSNRPLLMAQPGLFEKLCKLNSSPHETVRVNVAKALANLGSIPCVEAENTRPSERSPPREVAQPKAVTIKLSGLDSPDARNSVIKCLLGVKGVTSVTIDQRKAQAVVYTHSQEEMKPTLLEAIKGVELHEKSREPLKSVELDYLDDEDDAPPAGESALFKRSAKASLEARLAEKREKQAPAPLRKRDMVASAIGKVFGAFW